MAIKIKNGFKWLVIISLIAMLLTMAFLAILFWRQVTAEDKIVLLRVAKANIAYVFGMAMLWLTGLGFTVDWFLRFYIVPVAQLADELTLIHTVNPTLRIKVDGSRDVNRLVEMINKGAQDYASLKSTVEEKIKIAKAEAETEKNILAAIMAELPEGVLICNAEGQILLYNRQAREFFQGSRTKDGEEFGERGCRFVGLGRSVFGLIEKGLIVHALDDIESQLRHDTGSVASYFVIVGQNNELIKVEAVPILDSQRNFTGFILVLRDITQQLEMDSHLSAQFQAIFIKLRGALTAIRSCADLLHQYPEMDKDRFSSFLGIIKDEANALSRLINLEQYDFIYKSASQWPLVPMMASDLLNTVRINADKTLGLSIRIDPASFDSKIKVDSYTMLMALLFVLQQVHLKSGCKEFTAAVGKKSGFVAIDFFWQGESIKIETLRKWDRMQPTIQEQAIPFALRAVMRQHEAEIWSYSSKENERLSYLRLFIPALEPSEHKDPIRKMTILPESRPEFYDFDLFSQARQDPRLEERLLTELSYTVFDTETTGLNPAGGDEIISIGAVRIVHGRLLRHEYLDQLVNPQRPLPLESIKFHGIQPEMLIGQPTIDRVLPIFHRFTDNTILVAHNAAFDMRMLQLKEEHTGIKFINPVLDTMHLSAVVHSFHANHSLDTIARRLGISVIGRHTALGDAITTGEIFLKLIPLLADMGIHTLKEARAASQRTYYARLKY
jgi:DNA polymerase-3 subunit epsilon